MISLTSIYGPDHGGYMPVEIDDDSLSRDYTKPAPRRATMLGPYFGITCARCSVFDSDEHLVATVFSRSLEKKDIDRAIDRALGVVRALDEGADAV